MLPLDCNAVTGEAWDTDVMAVAAGVLAAGAAAAAVRIRAPVISPCLLPSYFY